jgi:transcriptional regulator with XRE-family HTH domain
VQSTDWPTLIRGYRERHGLKQQAFADEMGVDRITVYRWEKGLIEPSLEHREKLLSKASASVGEGVVRGLINFIDNLDGFATLLDAEFRVLRTTRKHQQLMGYDAAEVYGKPSQRYWSAQMEAVIKHVGGLKGYKRDGIYQMDLALVRQPGERGFKNDRPLLSIGRTVAIGDPRDPICHLTTLRVVETANDGIIPPCLVLGLDGVIPMPSTLA